MQLGVKRKRPALAEVALDLNVLDGAFFPT